MSLLNRIKVWSVASLSLVMVAVANAETDGAALKQANYFGALGEALSAAFMWIAFAISIIVLIGGCVFLIKDYVISKDHEKTFSIGKLVVAMIVAGILAEPTGSYVLGNDLAAGKAGQSAGQIDAGTFKRKTPGS
jgi:succinate dehydrogenase hydrophobic anchor subunit